MREVQADCENKLTKINQLEDNLRTQNEKVKKWFEKAVLMATYPDLTVEDVPVGAPESSVEGQMTQQINANQCRIQILRDENDKLRSALGTQTYFPLTYSYLIIFNIQGVAYKNTFFP